MSVHSWCRDIPRDEGVRAAEDNRQGPLPTLEEVIAAASPLPGRVEGTHWADWDRLREERDAAIRERDELRTECERLRVAQVKAAQERDKAHEARGRIRKDWEMRGKYLHASYNAIGTLKARVAELEAERDAAIQRADRDSVKCSALADSAIKLRARVAELEAAPAASGAASSSESPVSSEPDAWGVMRDGGVAFVFCRSFRRSAENFAYQWGGKVVPLYAAPPPARGWLTANERAAIESARDHFAAPEHDDDECVFVAAALRSILARSTPPEVVLPTVFQFSNLGDPLVALEQVKAALAAAGVKVKEVGRE